MTVAVAPRTQVAVRFCCRKCYGVLFVGVLAKGKLFCRPCQTWTPVDVTV